MKIPGKRSIEGNEVLEAEKFKAARTKPAGDKSQGIGQLVRELNQDKVQVSDVAKLLSDELSPSSLAEERQAKIAALKEQIRNGTYNPSSVEVAKALAGEIAQAITETPAEWFNDEESTL